MVALPRQPGPTAPPSSFRNRLLAALDPRSVLSGLEPVKLAAGDVLFHADEPIPAVYFLDSGLVSLQTLMSDGRAVQTAAIGPEGVVGVQLHLGLSVAVETAVVQIPGQAWRMSAETLHREVRRSRHPLHAAMCRYTVALITQMAQNVACARLHTVRQRLCTCLLTIDDSLPNSDLPLTHETLATMLGVRRASISEIATDLQAARVIDQRRGHVHVLQRQRLLDEACECYSTVKTCYDRLLPAGNDNKA